MAKNRYNKSTRPAHQEQDQPQQERAPRLKTLPEVSPRNESQKVYLDAIENNTITISSGPAGSGKAQPLYSKIRTPSGWKTMGEIKIGDWVCTPDGGTAKVLSVFPQGQKEIFRLKFNDGSSTDACSDHLWKVYNIDWAPTKERVISTAEIARCLALKSKRIRMYVPLPEAVYAEEKQLPLDPYLLGVLLGDGHLSTSTPRITSSDEELIGLLNDRLIGLDYSIQKIPSQKYEYSLKRKQHKNSENEYTLILRSMGLFGLKSYEKFIPIDYLNGSTKQRTALLQGLFDTDGFVGTKRSVSFTSTSKVLAEQVQFLVRSLGGLASLSSRTTQYTYNGKKKSGRISYSVFVRIRNPEQLFSLSRKKNRLSGRGQYEETLRKRIVSVEYVGKTPAQCILIDHPEHLYITDDFTVTHNTYLAVYEALKHHWMKGGMKRIVITRPAVEAGEKLGFLPGGLEEKVDPYMRPIYDALYDIIGISLTKEKIEREYIEIAPLAYMRGRTFNNCFIILDEAQNATFEQLKMAVTRIGENCKMVINGDPNQTDLPKHTQNGLRKLIDIIHDVPNVAITEFTKSDVVRSRVVADLVAAFEKHEEENERKD